MQFVSDLPELKAMLTQALMQHGYPLEEIQVPDGVNKNYINFKNSNLNIFVRQTSLDGVGNLTVYYLKDWEKSDFKLVYYMSAGQLPQPKETELDVKLKQFEMEDRQALLLQLTQRRVQYYSQLGPCQPTHEYLLKKGIATYAPCFKSDGRDLIVPISDLATLNVVSFQKITPDGGKFFDRGAFPDNAGFVLRAAQQMDSRVIVCEGVATACSIFSDVRLDATVVAAMSLQNVRKLARFLKEKGFTVIIAGEVKRGAGQYHSAYLSIKEVPVALPDNLEGVTDFNDLKQLTGEPLEPYFEPYYTPFCYIPLGRKKSRTSEEKEVWIKDSRTKEIVYLKKKGGRYQFETPDFNYLIEAFDVRNLLKGEDGKEPEFKVLCAKALDLAGETYSKASSSIGYVADSDFIEGGVFEGHSSGDVYYASGARVWNLTKKKRVYENLPELNNLIRAQDKNQEKLDFALNFDLEMFRKYDNFIHHFRWEEELRGVYSKLFIGWQVVAPLAAILKHRPHIWITGPTHKGKTFIIDKLLYEYLHPSDTKVRAQIHKASKAGGKQVLRNKFIPYVNDEMEITLGMDRESKSDINKTILRARQAATNTKAGEVQGTGNQIPDVVRYSFCACFGSINYGVTLPQDIARFINLKLLADENYNGLTKTQFLQMYKESTSPAFFENLYYSSLIQYEATMKNVDLFSELIEDFFPDISSHALTAVTTMLAGYFTVASGFAVWHSSQVREVLSDMWPQLQILFDDILKTSKRRTAFSALLADLMSMKVGLDEGIDLFADEQGPAVSLGRQTTLGELVNLNKFNEQGLQPELVRQTLWFKSGILVKQWNNRKKTLILDINHHNIQSLYNKKYKDIDWSSMLAEEKQGADAKFVRKDSFDTIKKETGLTDIYENKRFLRVNL